MKKGLFVFLLAFSVLGISGCGGSGFSAKAETFTFINAPEEVYNGNLPQLTTTERSDNYGYNEDPCTDYLETVEAVYTITNNTKQYMVDTPVLISLLDDNGKTIPDMQTVAYVNMGPKSSTNFIVHTTIQQLFGLEEAGDWEPTGEKRNDLSVYSCQVNEDAPAHVKDASGLSIELLTDKNIPETLKSDLRSDVAKDIDAYVDDTYKDEPNTSSYANSSTTKGQVIYNTYLSFEDVTTDLEFSEDDGQPNVEGDLQFNVVNETKETINTYGFETGFILREGKTILGGGYGTTRVGYEGIPASDQPVKQEITGIHYRLFALPKDESKVEAEIFVPAIYQMPASGEPIV